MDHETSLFLCVLFNSGIFLVLGVICKNTDMECETSERQYVLNDCDRLKNLNYDNQLAGKI